MEVQFRLRATLVSIWSVHHRVRAKTLKTKQCGRVNNPIVSVSCIHMSSHDFCKSFFKVF